MAGLRIGAHTFDIIEAGKAGDPLVLLLHGFPQTNHTWRHQLPALAAAGFHAVAPNQRGYSAGARPKDLESYRVEHLISDVLAMADALGAQQFHLVGHDWGGQVSWLTAALHPERIKTLSVLSRPHPAAFVRAMKDDAAQGDRSKHHRAFQNQDTVTRLLENDATRLKRTLADQGVPAADIDAYLSVLGNPDGLTAAVNWYRASATATDSALTARSVPVVTIPTLYIWGDADATVGRYAANLTAEYVRSVYTFVQIPDVGHFVTDQDVHAVNHALLAHLKSPPFNPVKRHEPTRFAATD
ncbi:MAG: alpha/beta hydrolase [Gammaproteobacteria bacterium]|nr:alpha/beta hydrolase [Gammaproteobacteria bacterium]